MPVPRSCAGASPNSSPMSSTRPTPVYREQVEASGDPHFHPPVMEDLKAEATCTWTLEPVPARTSEYGAGLSNLEYAPLCELMGQSTLSQEATNCSAPDTGNMELLTKFGTPMQVEQFLLPLLVGRDPLVLRDDRTVGGELRRHQHPESHRPRRRRLRDQRAQVVDERRGVVAVHVRDPHGRVRPRRRPAPPPQHGARAVRHPGRVRRALAARVRPRRRRRALRDALRERAHPEGVPPRRGGRRLRDRAGPPRSRPHPPLHARHRHGREGAAS